MSLPSNPDAGPAGGSANAETAERNIVNRLPALFVLLGIAVVVGVVDLLIQGQSPSWAAAVASWVWVLNVILVIFAIAIVLWVVRLAFWSAGVTPREHRRDRRRDRWGNEPSSGGGDNAVGILRERLARGEISQEQFEQTLRELGQRS